MASKRKSPSSADRPKRPRDVNQLAHFLVKATTEQKRAIKQKERVLVAPAGIGPATFHYELGALSI